MQGARGADSDIRGADGLTLRREFKYVTNSFMKFPLFLFTAALAAWSTARGDVLITEFLANNNTGLADEDGALVDWMELHNNGAEAVSLDGWHLTDNATVPEKWTFPAVSLPAGGYLVVFASGKDRAIPGQNLHTNFSLAAAGEYLALVMPNGTVAMEFAPAFPPQTGDVSYGLVTPVAGADRAHFAVPTPGAANDGASALTETVVFSETSRTFNQGTSFNVQLSTPSGQATIRYTINRAMPIDVEGVAPTVTVAPATDVWTAVGHGLKTNDPVQLYSTSSSYPTGSGTGITYFVTVLSADTFQLSNDLGGTPLDVTTTGTNLHLRRHAARANSVAAAGTLTIPEHSFYARDEVRVSTTGVLPTGLSTDTSYYVIVTDRNTIRLATTPTATSGLTFASIGSGVLTVRRMPSPVYEDPIVINHSLRLRARSFQAGRIDGPPVSESYLMLDAAAQAFTSNIPLMILHSFGSGTPNSTAPGAGTPEDTKEDVWFVFEPKLEGETMVARLTNPPDMVAPGYFERRGSSTFGAAKFSMTMGAFDEFGEGGDVSPLGFASNDDFVLNSPYDFDRSLVHNDLAYRLSNEVGRWAPRTRHVELFMSMNNDVGASGSVPAYGVVTGATTGADYFGVYSFQDKISRGANRLDVEKMELTDNTAPNVQGGYVFKIDRLDAGDSGVGAAGRSFALVQPKEWTSYPGHVQVATNAQKAYLASTLNAMYSALQSPSFMDPATGYAAHLDVPAAIDHWWLSLLPKSADAFRLSGYWHKARFGKLTMGPVFDFDRAMGSTDGRDLNPATWRGDNGDLGTDYFHSAGIFSPNYFDFMFRDPNYWQATIDRYEELRRTVLSTAHVHAIIDEYTETLDPGNAASTPAKRNFLKWTTRPRGAAGNTPGTDGTFRGEMQWLKNWWAKAGAVTANGRLDFVDGQFMRPPVASVVSGPVPANGAVTLSSPSQSIPGVKIYYSTSGDPRARSTTTEQLFTQGSLATLATILPEVSSVRATVPTSNDTGGTLAGGYAEWQGADLNADGDNSNDFDDSTWFTNAAGTINGVGYDNSFSGAVDYQPYFRVRWNTPTYWGNSPAGINPPGVLPVSASNVMFAGSVNGTSYAGNQSCFIRWPFTVTADDLAKLNQAGATLSLQMRYDDGFIAWINGTELTSARANAPAAAGGTPRYAYNAAATGTHDDGQAITYVGFDITAFASALHVGTNMLAVQGLNSGLGSSDFVMQAKILVQGDGAARPAYVPNLTQGATEYTAPLQITGPTKVVARTLHPLIPSDPPTANGGGTGPVPNGSSWSGPSVFYFFPGAEVATPTNVRLTEVHYHPAPPSPEEITAGFTSANDFEFIRITNVGTEPVDLTGAYFSDGVEFTSAEGLQNWLPPGASVLVVENTAAFAFRYGAGATILGQYSGQLDDAGEQVTLRDKTGAIIADFTYDDVAPWPPEADGERSLVYSGNGPQGDAANWTVSLDPGGTGVVSFDAWKKRYFAAADLAAQTELADTDGDGLPNLLEYALGLDPRVPDAAARPAVMGEIVDGEPAVFRIVRRRGAEDIAFDCQTSTGLDLWTTLTDPPTVTDNHDGTETVTWPLTLEDPAHYVRCRISNL